MRITTPFKRSWLNRQARLATANAVTLLAQLETVNDEAVELIEQGGVIASTSGNGESVQFFSPKTSGLSPLDISGLCDEMINRHDEAKAALIAAGTPAPTDGEILTQILSGLEAMQGYTPDFTDIAK